MARKKIQPAKVVQDRSEVFGVLMRERTYQRLRWGVRQRDGSMVEQAHSVGDFLVYIQHYLNAAIRNMSMTSGSEAAMADVRKIAALCVACAEQHGIPERTAGPDNKIINGHDGLPTDFYVPEIEE